MINPIDSERLRADMNDVSSGPSGHKPVREEIAELLKDMDHINFHGMQSWSERCRQVLTQLGQQAAPAPGFDRPKIICLCGSTRFIETFAIKTWELERQGSIVLGCTLLPRWYCKVPSHFGEATGTKEQCDELHLRKIDLADEVFVLNVGGYIGESTRNEIAYAEAHGKPVKYLELLPAPPGRDTKEK